MIFKCIIIKILQNEKKIGRRRLLPLPIKTFKILPPHPADPKIIYFLFLIYNSTNVTRFAGFLLERSSFTSKISSLTTNIGKHTESSMYAMTF